jgi:YegS/Rv2252/BmrU family lipid kinase
LTVQHPVVVVNPAKLDDPKAMRDKVGAALTDAGLPRPGWVETTPEDPGEGQTRQALADGADLILALGGDGTVRSCAAALAGTEVPLALLPAGTGNLLARNLGIPLGLKEAVAVAAADHARRIDLARLDAETYAVMAGGGFDALLFQQTSEDLKARVGWLAYVSAGIRSLRKARPQPLELVVDGVSEHLRAIGVIVGNVSTLTGGIDLLPDARADDGLIHVAVLRPDGLRGWVGLAARLLTGRRARPQELALRQGCEIEVWWGRSLPVEVDGDVMGERQTFRATVLPHALTVRTPSPASAG